MPTVPGITNSSMLTPVMSGGRTPFESIHSMQLNMESKMETGSVSHLLLQVVSVSPDYGKGYVQGHWAYGRTATVDFAKAEPRGVNNNSIIPWELERLSGSNARNGGHAAVRVEKI